MILLDNQDIPSVILSLVNSPQSLTCKQVINESKDLSKASNPSNIIFFHFFNLLILVTVEKNPKKMEQDPVRWEFQ